jgi:hypothetical protein
MGYYMGDYYAGSRGDPGIGSFFKGIASLGASFIPGVGGGISKAIAKIGAGRAATAAVGVASAAGGAIMRHPIISAAGAAGIVGLGAAAEMRGVRPALSGGVCPKGYHLCKSKHGCKRGMFIKNRHMNVCNPRALRRSLRRAHGFAKFAMKAIHLTHPKKKGRFGGFKRRRSKK